MNNLTDREKKIQIIIDNLNGKYMTDLKAIEAIRKLFHPEPKPEMELPEKGRPTIFTCVNEDDELHFYCGYFKGIDITKKNYIVSLFEDYSENKSMSADYQYLNVDNYIWQYPGTRQYKYKDAHEYFDNTVHDHVLSGIEIFKAGRETTNEPVENKKDYEKELIPGMPCLVKNKKDDSWLLQQYWNQYYYKVIPFNRDLLIGKVEG